MILYGRCKRGGGRWTKGMHVICLVVVRSRKFVGRRREFGRNCWNWIMYGKSGIRGQGWMSKHMYEKVIENRKGKRVMKKLLLALMICLWTNGVCWAGNI